MKIKSLLFASVLLCANAFAAGTTNFNDQWGNPNEIGWGISLLQQGQTIFIDLFVYDANNEPTWFVAGASLQASSPPGHLVFTGNMLKVNAPYYGTNPYNPALASARQVGTLTFDADSINTATLTYSVDGVQVTKQVERELFEYENYNGSYIGGIVETVTNCGGNNGYRETGGTVTISQVNNTAMTLVSSQLNGVSCTYSGTYSQLGHMGAMDGSYSCTDGSSGAFSAYEMEKSVSGMTGRFSSQFGACTATGHFGGLLRQ